MVANTIGTNGEGTLLASGPGVQASLTVTDGSVVTTDRVMITERGRVRDSRGAFHAYVASVNAGSFVVKSDRDQLPSSLTFDYISVQTA